eukprot:11659860-Alexandrium_andersonii.AAC.1
MPSGLSVRGLFNLNVPSSYQLIGAANGRARALQRKRAWPRSLAESELKAHPNKAATCLGPWPMG